MIEKIVLDPDLTTARLLESFRENQTHGYLEKLAMRTNLIDQDALAPQFNDTLARLLENQTEQRRLSLIEKSRLGVLEGTEKQELVDLLNVRKETIKARISD